MGLLIKILIIFAVILIALVVLVKMLSNAMEKTSSALGKLFSPLTRYYKNKFPKAPETAEQAFHDLQQVMNTVADLNIAKQKTAKLRHAQKTLEATLKRMRRLRMSPQNPLCEDFVTATRRTQTHAQNLIENKTDYDSDMLMATISALNTQLERR